MRQRSLYRLADSFTSDFISNTIEYRIKLKTTEIPQRSRHRPFVLSCIWVNMTSPDWNQEYSIISNERSRFQFDSNSFPTSVTFVSTRKIPIPLSQFHPCDTVRVHINVDAGEREDVSKNARKIRAPRYYELVPLVFLLFFLFALYSCLACFNLPPDVPRPNCIYPPLVQHRAVKESFQTNLGTFR